MSWTAGILTLIGLWALGFALSRLNKNGETSNSKPSGAKESTTDKEGKKNADSEKTTTVSKLREKISSFRWVHAFAVVGIFLVCMFIIGMVSAPFRDKPAPIEDGPSHTLPELRAGETYNVQFCREYGRVHQIELLDKKRFNFQNIDVRIVVPGTGGNNVEFRYDGKRLFDKSGKDTKYTLSNLPNGNCFILKIGDKGKRLIPARVIRVISTLNDYEKNKQAEHAP